MSIHDKLPGKKKTEYLEWSNTLEGETLLLRTLVIGYFVGETLTKARKDPEIAQQIGLQKQGMHETVYNLLGMGGLENKDHTELIMGIFSSKEILARIRSFLAR